MCRTLTEILQVEKNREERKFCKGGNREITMKKLSKMIIVALGLVLLASGVASAKLDILAKAPVAPVTSR